jgi:hypothetical protein
MTTTSNFSVEQKHFPNYGYSLSKMPADVLSAVKKDIEHIQTTADHSQKIHNSLAGHIETQMYLGQSVKQLEPYILEMAVQYILSWNYQKEIFSSYSCEKPLEFILDKVWINFQKKYEYNPLHDHSGIFSFVSWIQIPYDLQDEMNMPHVINSNFSMASSFNFVFTNVLGSIQSLPFFPDHDCEGTILFFPSKFKHLVYPFFTSDKNRISISGNLFLKT